MRNLFIVLKTMKALIPEGQEILQELCALYSKMEKEAAFTPPESMDVYWNLVSKTLSKFLTVPLTEEWHFQVIATFVDKDIADVKTFYSKPLEPTVANFSKLPNGSYIVRNTFGFKEVVTDFMKNEVCPTETECQDYSHMSYPSLVVFNLRTQGTPKLFFKYFYIDELTLLIDREKRYIK